MTESSCCLGQVTRSEDVLDLWGTAVAPCILDAGAGRFSHWLMIQFAVVLVQTMFVWVLPIPLFCVALIYQVRFYDVMHIT